VPFLNHLHGKSAFEFLGVGGTLDEALERSIGLGTYNRRSWLTDKTLRPSPPTPLPERERGARTPKFALVPLLPLWEKGLGDEGDLFCQSTSRRSLLFLYSKSFKSY
jgi:hypothetical protein